MPSAKLLLFTLLLISSGCRAQQSASSARTALPSGFQTGAEQFDRYMPQLKGKRVGMVVNQTSVLGKAHLVDSLLAQGVTIKTIFAPERGFRGQASAGEKISNSRDPKTGVGIISLYGKNYKPTAAQLDSLDAVVFDIQDVGARFYTYISTLHYVMEACAENNKPLIVLDRPNPNGHYVDGPVLDPQFRSFVGMHPIPVVHGLTVGELARMINGEKWLAGDKTCTLAVVLMKNYRHDLPYDLPVAPSPNLPNRQAVLLYPSLCFFEGTVASIGRGTDKQFQLIGTTDPATGDYTFTPVDKPGAVNPPNEDKACYGVDLSDIDAEEHKLKISYLINFYQKYKDKENFFLSNNFVDKLAGTDQLRKQIQAGMTEAAIRKTWEPGLEKYRKTREKYLLYP